MGIRRTVALATVVAAAAGVTSALAAPMIPLYDTKLSVKKIIAPGTSTALPVDGRLHIVEPNGGHLLAGDRDKPYRLDKVSDHDLVALKTGERMAAFLKNRIDNPCRFSWGSVDCRSGIVMVDEISNAFKEPAPNTKIAPWTLSKDRWPTYVPRPKEGQPGLELSQAMTILAGISHPDGGTYAQHVHFFLAPGPVSSIGKGYGAYHNLARNGKPLFASFEGMRRAFQLSGGVWLEMYHFSSGRRYPFNTAEWKRYPRNIVKWMTRPGTSVKPAASLVAKTHFMMSNNMPARVGTNNPGACLNPRTPQGCQFALAALPANRAILMNGPGAYRMEGNELEWRTHVRRLFFR